MANKFFINMMTLVSFIYFNGVIDYKFHLNKRKLNTFISGIIFGILGLLLMYFTIELNADSIADLRHLAIIIVSTYVGPIAGLITAFIISTGRILMFGLNSASVTAAFFMLFIGIVCSFISKTSMSNFKKINIMNLFSLIIIFITLSVNLKSYKLVIGIFPYHIIFSTISGFFAYIVADYVRKSNLNFYELKYTSSHFKTLLANLNSGILAEDTMGNITFINKKFCNMFKINTTPEELIGKNSDIVLEDMFYFLNNKDNFIKRNKVLIKNQKLLYNEELTLKDGRTVERDYIPIFNEDEYIGHYWSYNDISRRKFIENRLKNLSEIDGLTGIPNRRTFNESFKYQWNKSMLNNTPLSIIMLDIDYFKLYNDNYGHLGGDECLKKVANAIMKIVDGTEFIAARYGGEEFAVIMPNSDINKTFDMANKIKNEVANLKIPHKASLISSFVTLSLGIASMVPKENVNMDKLIMLSDKALYKAKNEGRNQIKVCE